MKISYFTDYSLRVLLYLSTKGELATVGEIAEAFNISKNHLVKVVHNLSKLGLIETTKGKHGGIRLNTPADKLRLGKLLELLEPMSLVECFDKETNQCPIIGVCELEKILYRARAAFLEQMNLVTLASMSNSKNQKEKERRLGLAGK